MATVDYTNGAGSTPAVGAPANTYVLESIVDFNKNSRSSADVLQMLSIPAKTLVHTVQFDVLTAEGGTLTFDIGDGSDADGFIDGANGNSVASGVNSLALTEAAPNTVTGYSNGKYYSAADTIDLLINNDADAAKIVVRAVCTSLEGSGLVSQPDL